MPSTAAHGLTGIPLADSSPHFKGHLVPVIFRSPSMSKNYLPGHKTNEVRSETGMEAPTTVKLNKLGLLFFFKNGKHIKREKRNTNSVTNAT